MTIYTVIFKADNGLSLEVLAGPTSPVLSDGFGGWAVVDRPKRIGVTRFIGRNPLQQTLSLRFDGLVSGTSQEPQINLLERMARQAADNALPPKIKLGGIAHRKDLTWVINELAYDTNADWITKGGSPVRVRQDVTVTLLQYVDDDVILTASSPALLAQSSKKKVSVTTPNGMTLKQVAIIEYPHNIDKGIKLLIGANALLNPDPRKTIPKGTTLIVPDINSGNAIGGVVGGVYQTFVVP